MTEELKQAVRDYGSECYRGEANFGRRHAMLTPILMAIDELAAAAQRVEAAERERDRQRRYREKAAEVVVKFKSELSRLREENERLLRHMDELAERWNMRAFLVKGGSGMEAAFLECERNIREARAALTAAAFSPTPATGKADTDPSPPG
jgi:septal ring factor EnvC (AmiA/AmiB activator)